MVGVEEQRGNGERFWYVAACFVIFVDTIGPANFEQVALVQVAAAAGALAMLVLLFTERAGARTTLIFVGAVGVLYRVVGAAPLSSDVNHATGEALATLARGLNPYLHYYTTTNPPGSPFVYLPGELALYAIQSILPWGLATLDRGWGILVLLAILALAPICGYGRAALAGALYATNSVTLWRSMDGSNDTALAFLASASIVLLAYGVYAARRARDGAASHLHDASALVLGWALAFKALSWPVLPFLALFVAPQRRLRYALLALVVFACFVVPFAVAAPVPFFIAVTRFDAVHTNVWGFDLWASLINQGVATQAQLEWLVRLRFVLPLLVGVALLFRRAATLGGALLQGGVVLGTALLVALWSTSSYYAYLIALMLLALPALSLDAEPHKP